MRYRRIGFLFERLAVFVLAAVSSVQAQRYNFQTYTQAEGLSDLTVVCFLQDRTGFLWVGTNNGLFRYDGHRFRRYGIEAGLSSASISSLIETSDGTLWVAALNGVSRRTFDTFVPESLGASFPTQGQQTLAENPSTNGVYVASDKGLVSLSPKGGRFVVPHTTNRPVWGVFSEPGKGVWYTLTDEICLWNGTGNRCYDHREGFTSDLWGGVAVDGDGTLWVRSATRLLALSAGAARFVPRDLGLASSSLNGVVCLDAREHPMIPTDGGLYRWTGSGWSLISAKDGLVVGATTWAMEDREGSLWIGMRGGGLARLLGSGEWENWTTAQGLDSDQIWSIAHDRTGAILIGTNAGLNRLRGRQIETVPGTNLGLTSNRVRSIAVDSDNNVWLGTAPGGLAKLDSQSGRITRFDVSPGLPSARVLSVLVDRNHSVWVASANGLFRGFGSDVRWNWNRQFPPDTVETESFYALLEDREGRVWVAGSEGTAMWDGRKWLRLAHPDGRRTRLASYLAEDGGGQIWVGYRIENGIDRISTRDGRWVTERVPSDGASQVPDVTRFLGFGRAGNLWRGTEAGVLVLTRNKHWIRYTHAEGLAWDDTGMNAFLIDPDGSVWLGTSRGLSHHAQFTEHVSAPPAAPLIVGLQAGDRVLSPNNWGLRIDERTGAIFVSYASLAFRHQQDVRFRYRLRGLDKEWTITDEWQARYSGLKPGSYLFEVATWDGQLSSQIAQIPLTVVGPWWRSTWFYATFDSLIAAFLFAWWRARERVARELRKAKEAAESAREAAQSANRSKSVFLANMSHEIRTPLNAVLGYSQLMLRDPALSSSAKENLNIINRSGEHLLVLINDILDMSKIEAGKVILSVATFDLFDLLVDLEMMFRLSADAKGLKFQVLVESECEASIEADQGKIRQVLVNLLGNAVKFTESGCVTLRVSMSRGENESFRLFFAVEDTGPGIASSEQGELFLTFTQSQSGREQHGGNGLGLAISRELVRLMGGRIMLNSELGRGSTFYFEIPVCSCASLSTPKTERPRVAGLQSGKEPPCVLIVDDEPTYRGWLTSLLRAAGFTVQEAPNGEMAIQLWQESKPQLILMDMRMPVMDGMETTRRIRALPGGHETVVLALTASAMEEHRRAAMDSGVDDFLSKPCMEAELLRKVRKYLGISYIFEDENSCLIQPVAAEPTLEIGALRSLPPQLVVELRHAVSNGKTDRLNSLIEKVAGLDKPTANSLRRLADNYEYDALTHLLEEIDA